MILRSEALTEAEAMEEGAEQEFLYVLPHPGFFSDSGATGGHLAHSRGFVAAAARLWSPVTVICAQDGKRTFESLPVRIDAVPKGTGWSRLTWTPRVLRLMGGLARREYRPTACYLRYSARFSFALPAARRSLCGIPLAMEVNSLGSQYHGMLRTIDARALCSADLIVVVSDVIGQVVKNVGGRSCPPVLVVPNGVDLARFREPTDLTTSPRAPATPTIGYVGVLKPEYGLEELIAAFKLVRGRFPAARLSIVGDGPFRQALHELVRDVDGADVYGPVPFDAVPGILRSMDVLVCTQSARNAHVSPVKLFEYLAAGKAVVAARIPQISAMAERSQAFLTYRCGDSRDLADRICTLVGSEEIRMDLGRRAAQEAQKHSWDDRVRMVHDAIAQLR